MRSSWVRFTGLAVLPVLATGCCKGKFFHRSAALPMAPTVAMPQEYVSPAAPAYFGPAVVGPEYGGSIPAGGIIIDDQPGYISPMVPDGGGYTDPGVRSITPTRPPSADPADAEASGITRYHAVSSMVSTGGQPTREGFQWLQERGFRTVVNLRSSATTDALEPNTVSQLGMLYVALPVELERIDRDLVDDFRAAHRTAANQPVFLHDGDGSIVGAMWFLDRMLNDKVSRQQAEREAREMGLPSETEDPELWNALDRVMGL